MLATMQAAVAEAELIPAADRTVPDVGAAMRLGALMGARGNSGVILSQIFRGMAEVVTSVDRVNGAGLARAFEHGCRAAFAAVAQPVEGHDPDRGPRHLRRRPSRSPGSVAASSAS